ncbi:general amino acid permease, putative [Talaromyces stipitatus ATCC 10500]|uniref:General amino acid permease, putative n=1 Tax=Talaromyces stipitatus (strain ATCC 10500 / CBS 375.48 / QM 6759 / NRRL 1006) TaxID=441959 RepID=B8MMF1_TALSN|nr:general amino acid permease, putative [Talaromyces stipitatus ATCC 10500]EED13705.1 general amino acid permease, putative [Talaromyces stipitatus ATCC 10500]
MEEKMHDSGQTIEHDPKPAIGSTEETFVERQDLRQGLHDRHIEMIALAGCIGTGLFLGSGLAIHNAGPAGAFLGYSLMGIAVCAVCLAIGEMGALVPLSGGIIRYADLWFDPALAFANGWNVVYGFLIGTPAEIVAASVLVEFWVTVNNAIWITVFGTIIIASVIVFVRVYGELEFFFAWLKILLILGVNLMALVITCGGGPNHQSIGFRYWSNPGPFNQYLGYGGSLGRFMGFWTTLTNAAYSYANIESFTYAAAETRSPRRNIPIAAKRIFIRILLFYVISILMVSLVVPSDSPELLHQTGTASQSPFVIAANSAGVKVVPHIINAIVITSAWSSANSNMLYGSRAMYGLAKRKLAPKAFLRLNRFQIPWVPVTLLGTFIALGYMSLSSTSSTVFQWLQSLVSISTLVNWIVILATYLRLYYGCKAQNIDRKELPWAAPFQPYFTWVVLTFFICIVLTNGYTTFLHGHWSTQTFVSSYLNIPIVVTLYFGYKWIKKTKIPGLAEIPIREFIDNAHANPEPLRIPKRGLQRLNIFWS